MQFHFGQKYGVVPFKLAEHDWTHNWKAAQLRRGVVPGDTVVPGKTHPDVGKTFPELKPSLIDNLTLLAVLRLTGFIARGEEVLLKMVAAGNGQTPLPFELHRDIAESLHEQWLLWYRLQDGPPRAGYCHWDDEPEEFRENDLLLVEQWCQTMALLAKEDEAWKISAMDLLFQRIAK